jgi:hypothetical protein
MGKTMSKQDKHGRRTGAGKAGKRENPGLEVVNIYGSGPLPVGERDRPEPEAEDTARTEQEKNRGALSTSQKGGGPQNAPSGKN